VAEQHKRDPYLSVFPPAQAGTQAVSAASPRCAPAISTNTARPVTDGRWGTEHDALLALAFHTEIAARIERRLR